MGSRSKVNLAYIAGFLDGDGSLMLQVKKRKDSKIGIRFMATICFYQDTRHEKPLLWIRDELGIGYLSQRKDGMSELRINGFVQIKRIIKQLMPYIKFKQIQAEAILSACEILNSKTISSISKQELRKLANLILIIQNQNYSSKKKKDKKELFRALGLTP